MLDSKGDGNGEFYGFVGITGIFALTNYSIPVGPLLE